MHVLQSLDKEYRVLFTDRVLREARAHAIEVPASLAGAGLVDRAWTLHGSFSRGGACTRAPWKLICFVPKRGVRSCADARTNDSVDGQARADDKRCVKEHRILNQDSGSAATKRLH
jgi:hypothetical protein